MTVLAAAWLAAGSVFAQQAPAPGAPGASGAPPGRSGFPGRGGAQTIQNGLTHPELFHYIGVFSISGGGEQYEKANDTALKKAAAALKLVYYAYGREDFVAKNSEQLKGTLNKYGIKFTLHETGGGHTWINWREYLNDFAPRLFK